jgi:phospholipid/cholesterol/gamma-HCH transport system substrate-binding protein
MATKAQKIRVGSFTLASAALLAVVLIGFGGVRFWEKHDAYRVVFADSVMGLDPGARVYVNGLRVGSVDDVALSPDHLGQIIVTISVKEGTPVRTDTRAMLSFAGITGLKVIDLCGGTAAAPRLAPGSVIPVGEGTLDKLTKEAETLTSQLHVILERATTVVDNLGRLTAPQRFAGVDAILTQAQAATADLAATSATMKAIVGENRAAVHATLAEVDAAARSTRALIAGEVHRLVSEADGVVGDVGGVVTELKGVVRDNQGQVRAALRDLRQASRSFKDLARELRQRPSQLLFSDPAADRRLP